MKKSLFESKFITSLRNRKNTLIKEDAVDALADDLETEMEAPTAPISPEEADLEAGLAEGNPEVEAQQQQTMEDIKNEDQMLKDKIQARIESANQEIIGFAERVEEFLSILNDPFLKSLDFRSFNERLNPILKIAEYFPHGFNFLFLH